MFKRTKVSAAAVLALGALVGVGAHAQNAQRIEITGSSIKRIDGETALPVTILKMEDLAKQGVTTAEQAMARITANQGNFGQSASVGGTTGGKAEADLRGLSGPTDDNANKTLVLLNGRRLANHAFDSAAVDLNAIPIAAVDRIEVLRDGASAIYGTDAIGGVINFVLKRDFQGVEVSGSYQRPEEGSPGETKRASIVAGFGSVVEDKFNVMFALDWRQQKALKAVDRGFGSTGILGTDRASIVSGTSGTAFPGDLNGFEPSGPNCEPPNSVPINTATDPGKFGSCRYDFTRSIDLIPENEQLTGLLRGSLALSADHMLTAEYVYSNNKATSRVAPAPTSHLMLASSPFFPSGATANDIDNLIPFFGLNDPNPGAPTLGGSANWRQVPAGQRTTGDDTTTDRLVLELEGTFSGFDYRTAIGRSTNKSTASVKRGYVNDGLVQQGVWDGVINPFGTHGPDFGQTAGGLAAIDAAQVVADTQIGKSTIDFFDARATANLWKMDAGNAVGAFGFEYRKEKSSFEATDITAQLGSLGIDPDGDTSGSRNVWAAFAELGIPLRKDLDLTLAARYDRYSDFGGSFNPKVGLRFLPMDGLALRGSYNTGFRAPTLYEIYQPPSLTFTTDNYDDPVLCPGGTPVAGTSDSVVCGQQVLQRNSGPVGSGGASSDLEPEESQSWTVGLVFEPMRNVSLTVDYWQLKVKNLISAVPEQELFGNFAKFSGRFVRCSTVAAGGVPGVDFSDIDACTNLNASQDPIAFVEGPNENLGELHVQGFDFSASWRSAGTGYGVFGIGFDGTLITKYEYQREKGGQFIDALGRYSDAAPVFEWQHMLQFNWSKDVWGASLVQRYKSGYTDQGGMNEVDSYLLHDLSVSYVGIKNLTLTFGINNLFDEDPPFTVQTTTFQRGYDPRFTDPIGRSYLIRAAYRF